MLTVRESSPFRITSSPSLSPQSHPSISLQPLTSPFMQTIHDAEEPATMPHDYPRRVKKLEHKIQEDAETQGRTSANTKILLEQEEPTELVEDLGSGEKGEKEISIANIPVSTASATPEVSIAAANLVYIRRSAEKRKDKGKAIMKEDESVQKKAKKQLEQERLGHEEAIRLQEQNNAE
ncbi:hypothetical protein Tco_1305055 [Tanacetum coccineum]